MGEKIWEWERVLGQERKFSIEREVRKWKPDHASAIYRKMQLDGLRSYRDLSSTKSRQTWICQGAVEDLSTTKVPRWIEKLSRIYQLDRKFLDRLRSYRDKFQKVRWIEIALTSIEKRRKRGSIDTKLLRICREAVELEENRFFKERKNT